ncbi:hypothetical protein IE81DRAFT_234941 [Ceraceosorus guamensis]|uniref:Uncharacterized protein n=1 Tax=Ceraceosorus guamensis TaxID=1522189 RepID=A0A316VSP8_9BASI|nr:hypothetical protein IE81DRAFT_234941 [Ceraceosorus guamensis]PWN40244.1 hypothetical protein IE81DRAFT_234941 [Ceraceosorus guamensis]
MGKLGSGQKGQERPCSNSRRRPVCAHHQFGSHRVGKELCQCCAEVQELVSLTSDHCSNSCADSFSINISHHLCLSACFTLQRPIGLPSESELNQNLELRILPMPKERHRFVCFSSDVGRRKIFPSSSRRALQRLDVTRLRTCCRAARGCQRCRIDRNDAEDFDVAVGQLDRGF